MILLRRLLVAQPALITDTGTQNSFPYAVYPNITNNINDIESFSPSISLCDHISMCLRSKKPSLICWGLSKFTQCAKNDKKCLQNLHIIFSFLNSKDLLLEYMAANCLLDLSKSIGKIVAAPLLSPILSKINEYPAIEYVHILSNLIPFLTPQSIDCCIVPLVDRFINHNSESYHYALAELLISVPFKIIHITTDIFLKFLNSIVIINNYLTQIIKSASKAFSKEWIGKILPSHLLGLANNKPFFRYGILKTVLSLSDIFFQKYFINYITNALNWANNGSEDPNIELILASKADEILLPKTIDLSPKMKDILYKVSHSNDPMIRFHLPSIITNNPSAFFGMDLDLQDVFFSLANDKSPEIRLAFIESFSLIFRLSTGWTHINKDSLIALLIHLLKDPSPMIKNRLCTSNIYSAFGNDRLFTLMPHFFELASTIQNWRSFAELIKTFISWPNKVICNFWIQFSPIISNAAEKWPHALAPNLQSFYVKVSIFLNDEMEQKFEEIIIEKYAKSPDYRMRELFLKIAGVLCFKTQRISLIHHIWNRIKDFESNDPVISVRGKTVPQLIKFRVFFFENSQISLEDEVTSKFNEMRKLYQCYDDDNNNNNNVQTNLSEIQNDNSQNSNNIVNVNNSEKYLAEKQYMQDILRENWIIFNKEMASRTSESLIKHSKSLDITKNNLDDHQQMNDKLFLPSTKSSVGFIYQKFKPTKVVQASKTNIRLMQRKSLGDSKLPPIVFH